MHNNNTHQQPPQLPPQIAALLLQCWPALMQAQTPLSQSNCIEEEERFLTKRQAAKMLNVSLDTISRRIKDGSLIAQKLHGAGPGAVRISTLELKKYLSRHLTVASKQ